jgi:hypothetical protein
LRPCDRAVGLALYTGNLFPEWNSFLVGSLRGQMLDRVTLFGKKAVSEVLLLADLASC